MNWRNVKLIFWREVSDQLRDRRTLFMVVLLPLFLYPILGPDSADKSRNLWCSKDPGKAWPDWMLRGQAAAPGNCDIGPLVRNMEFGRKHKITGTPTTVFFDGTRVPGAINAQEIEKYLANAKQ